MKVDNDEGGRPENWSDGVTGSKNPSSDDWTVYIDGSTAGLGLTAPLRDDDLTHTESLRARARRRNRRWVLECQRW